jgi:hypothetical protein
LCNSEVLCCDLWLFAEYISIFVLCIYITLVVSNIRNIFFYPYFAINFITYTYVTA